MGEEGDEDGCYLYNTNDLQLMWNFYCWIIELCFCESRCKSRRRRRPFGFSSSVPRLYGLLLNQDLGTDPISRIVSDGTTSNLKEMLLQLIRSGYMNTVLFSVTTWLCACVLHHSIYLPGLKIPFIVCVWTGFGRFHSGECRVSTDVCDQHQLLPR